MDKPKAVPKKKMAKSHRIKVSFEQPLEILQSGMSSVELKRNAKGIVEIMAKVYASNSEDAKKDVIKTFNDLSKEFPTSTS